MNTHRISVSSSLALASLLFVACSPATPAPVAPEAAPSASAAPATSVSASPSAVSSVVTPTPPPACLPKSVAKHPLAHVEVAGTEATVCVGTSENVSEGQSYPCVKVDAKTARVTAASAWIAPKVTERPLPVAPFTVATVGKDLKVCKAGAKDCATIKTGFKAPKMATGADGKDALIAAVNADGSKVFALDGEIRKGADPNLTTSLVVFGDTFDVKTGKRLSHVELTYSEKNKHVLVDQSDTWSVAWMGERVLVGGYRCCGPAGAKELLDPKTGKTLILGDPQFFLALDDTTWLLGNEGSSDQLTFVDIVAGKELAKVSLPNAPMDEGPELYALDATKLDGGTVLVAFANPPGVALLDVAKKSLSAPIKLPICP